MQQTASRSGGSDMTASDAESWARLRLVEGQSSAQKWELVSSLGHTTVTVGANADCTWVVRADGVRPIHFSLHWDGNTLRVADVYAAGDVRVDGVALTSQWKALVGTMRIEFGRAVIAVETSAAVRASERPHEVRDQREQPLMIEPRRGSGSPVRGSGKETLIGVAPQSLAGLQAALQQYSSSLGPEPSAGSSRPPGPSEPPRDDRSRSDRPPSDRAGFDRSMKATLVGGIGVTHTLPGSVPAGVPPSSSYPGSKVPAAGGKNVKANATLMGFANVDMMRGTVGPQPSVNVGGQAGSSSGGASLNDADQRTVQGFPSQNKSGSSAPPASVPPAGRRMTQKGMISQPPGVAPDAVAQAPMRSVSERPGARVPGRDPGESIGSAWQEKADVDPLRAGHTLRGVQEADDESSGARRAPRMGAPSQRPWEGGRDSMSDVPTQMRDPASFESRRPHKGFPWRYVGVLVLTGVAYFAWLYLLDHL